MVVFYYKKSDLDEYLRSKTGFSIKPVHGILSQREFLNALAHRHHKTPEYTPEPDIIHEVLGHIPMFCDPDLANLSQEIGIATLGVNENDIAKMGALYWYSIEFGSIKEDDKIKPYSAGIAGSIKECENYVSGIPKFKILDPFNPDFSTDYPIQDVQETYYYNNSFQDAVHMIIKYGQTFRVPMKCYYNFDKKRVETDKRVRAVVKDETGPLF